MKSFVRMSNSSASTSHQVSPTETDALLASALLGIKGNPKTESNTLAFSEREQSAPCKEINRTTNVPERLWPDVLHAFQREQSVALLRMIDKARSSTSLLCPSPHSRLHNFRQTETVSPQESSLLARRSSTVAFSLAPSSAFPGVDGSPGLNVSSKALSNDTSLGSPDSTKVEAVRREQIEAALQSKPQRGKKRKNLTEDERLELTRTRNREHARSTRNRKKARYDELLAKEEAFDKFERQHHLDQARRRTVVDFLNVRQQMVRQLGRSPTSAPLPEGGITHIVDDLDAFVFYDGNGDTQEIQGLQGMGRFDEKLISRTEDRFGPQATSLLTYSKSVDRVALSLENTASLDVDLFIQGQDEFALLSANLRVLFSAGSSKICSVEWRTLKDRFDEVPVDRLRVQNSYPSVVSFDPTTEGTQSIGMDVL